MEQDRGYIIRTIANDEANDRQVVQFDLLENGKVKESRTLGFPNVDGKPVSGEVIGDELRNYVIVHFDDMDSAESARVEAEVQEENNEAVEENISSLVGKEEKI